MSVRSLPILILSPMYYCNRITIPKISSDVKQPKLNWRGLELKKTNLKYYDLFLDKATHTNNDPMTF